MAIGVASDIFRPLGEDVAAGDLLLWTDQNNRRFSDRLWLARQTDRDAIDAILREAVVRGDDPLQAARRLEDYLTPVGQATPTKTPRSGNGNYAARRLARTEVTRAFGQATIQAAELNPFTRGLKWSLSGRHPKPDECDRNARNHSRGMEPGVYAPRDVPRYPNHPHDLCYLSPVTVEDTDAVVAKLRGEIGHQAEPLAALAPPRAGLLGRLVTLVRAAKALLG